MTAWGSIDLAVEAMRRGACDFVQKPWDNERVLAAIRKQANHERRRQSELEIAATVQRKLFPRVARHLRTIDYAAAVWPHEASAATTMTSWIWEEIPAKAQWDSCSPMYPGKAFPRRS